MSEHDAAAHGATLERAAALLLLRGVVGLQFFMAGWWKVFELGPLQHARGLFVEAFQESWIPEWLLWALGTGTPIVELLAGGLLVLGLRVREAGAALVAVLLMVTYGHLLQEPLFVIVDHVLPRTLLLAAVLLLPRRWDRWSLDATL